MNLTYEIKGNGYLILKDGKRWIMQPNVFLGEGETLEEVAQKHIDEIIEGMSNPTHGDKTRELEERLELAEEMLMEIMLNGNGVVE